MSRKSLLLIAAVVISAPALTTSNAFASKTMPVTHVSTFKPLGQRILQTPANPANKVGSQISPPPQSQGTHGHAVCYPRVC
jgi:hypothetical protein